MQVITSIDVLRKTLKPLAQQGKTIGLVPTMGALHDGHGALIKASVKDCDVTVVSVFLNPIQFGKNEDLDSIPSVSKLTPSWPNLSVPTMCSHPPLQKCIRMAIL